MSERLANSLNWTMIYSILKKDTEGRRLFFHLNVEVFRLVIRPPDRLYFSLIRGDLMDGVLGVLAI